MKLPIRLLVLALIALGLIAGTAGATNPDARQRMNLLYNNPNQAIPHDVCVQTTSGQSLGCSKQVTGAKASLDLKNLKAGSYTFFCSVDSHQQAGMQGTLTVH